MRMASGLGGCYCWGGRKPLSSKEPFPLCLPPNLDLQSYPDPLGCLFSAAPLCWAGPFSVSKASPRRNVPVIRPHSWHLAKLSEGRTEAPTMPCPPDAFSLSWHSGCDASDLSLPWSPLSRHCSTDRSSSLGSMESLGPAGQSYLEGSLSPIDQAMYQDKRDSAYSSFSASSNASDSALRPEEGLSTESATQKQPPPTDPRYLQTGVEGGDLAAGSRGGQPRLVTCAQTSAQAAPSAPQPPIRQDSLRACNPLPEGPPNLKGRWTSDTSLCVRGQEIPGSTGHSKDSLATEQYYLLSSHTDQVMEKGVPNAESLLNDGDEGDHPTEDRHLERKNDGARQDRCPDVSWPGPPGHRHSAPEHLLAAQLQMMNVSHVQEGPQWTVSPLHMEQKGPKAWQNQIQNRQRSPEQAEEPAPRLGTKGGTKSPLERPRSASVELPPSLSVQHQQLPGSGDPSVAPVGMNALTEGVRDAGRSHPAAKKGGSAPHRSAQMRRRSDRFATNLRNEIQWRKAQLQKSKGSAALLFGEEAVEEAEEPPKSPSGLEPPSWSPPSPPPAAPSPLPPPPPPSLAESRPHRSGPSIKRWSSELSVFGGDGAYRSPGPESRLRAPGPERPPKSPLPPVPGRGGRWRWSPEHKLQPHNGSPQPPEPESPSRHSEESGLLPFADRRRFFEESSKPLSPTYSRFGGVPPSRREEERSSAFQPVSCDHIGQQQQRRRHSMDHSYPSEPTYQEFYQPLPRRRPDWECWQPLPFACAPREACPFCYGDQRCPPMHHRNPPAPPGHCAHRCHPLAWTRCPDCCCPTPHQRLEERGGLWLGRKAFPMEFPADEWEPPAINRKTSQSMSELPQHQMGFARTSPFWTCFEEPEPEHPPSFCRTSSSSSSSWDREGPGREAMGLEEPHRGPVRGRAYSESHLGVELPSGRDGREAHLAKVEEAPLEPPCGAQRRGPPPPRPPPPNWEKYRTRCQLQPTRVGTESPLELARKRSQSLPLEQLRDEGPRGQSPSSSCASPSHQAASSSSPPRTPTEPGSLRYYCHRSPCQSPEWPTPDPSDRSTSSRPSSSLEEEATPESAWENGQSGLIVHRTMEPASPGSLPRIPSPKEHHPAQSGAAIGALPCGTVRGPGPTTSRLDSQELMRDVAGRDRSLAGVLGPSLGKMTAAEVMEDLFSAGDGSAWTRRDWSAQDRGQAPTERQLPQPAPLDFRGTPSSPSCSAYYNTSVGKAEVPPKGAALSSEDEEEELDCDLAQKKVQLIESISRKLLVLQEAQRGLQDDLSANLALGKEVEGQVKGVCKAHEFEKFRLFIGDLDKVVNLLLSLSGRLARVENTLSSLDPDTAEAEKLTLLEKKRQLSAQLEDARELQEHVAQRERLVFACVSRCLPSEQLQDYQHFVRMKSALAIQQRQLDDKIKLGEEQLRCLRESLRRTGPRDS
ncbi:protein Shroom4 isoform X1 [Anolis carolinensis]|uniref:protein Shroom4 isoform X1 n=1 Tax=Anolis carolinensis TaxID=28377 RepID=UPI002F2B7AD1